MSEKLLTEIRDLLRQLVGQSSPTNGAAAVATDRDLDSQYGDPVMRMKSPRDWSGDDMIGRKFSECPAEYLDMIAERFDYFAVKADKEGKVLGNGKPESQYKRLDAARARGWAKRIRAGYVAPKPDTNDAEWGEDAGPRW